MSKTKQTEKITNLLWAQSAGRCEYEGCNKILYKDCLTKRAYNSAYIAHIVADSENGPRGDQKLSKLLSKDIDNLMLLCDEHHRLIDKVDVDGHTVDILKTMKKKHEDRIKILTDIAINKESNIVVYKGNIGNHESLINYQRAVEAIVPDRYPSDRDVIDLSINSSVLKDYEEKYWEFHIQGLERNFNEKIKYRMNGWALHYSLFGLAPQPLLIKLGSLLSDIYNVDVYQLHREPSTWRWLGEEEKLKFSITNNSVKSNIVALNISLSADIDNSRIENILGKDTCIWTITIDKPNNDFLKSKNQLEQFRVEFRKVLNEIKKSNNKYTEINVFPAMPVAVAIELGRIWMPKADLDFKVYDENRSSGGFIPAFTLRKNEVK